jgi:hypothetical protein
MVEVDLALTLWKRPKWRYGGRGLVFKLCNGGYLIFALASTNKVLE